jgi:hypothetical protein
MVLAISTGQLLEPYTFILCSSSVKWGHLFLPGPHWVSVREGRTFLLCNEVLRENMQRSTCACMCLLVLGFWTQSSMFARRYATICAVSPALFYFSYFSDSILSFLPMAHVRLRSSHLAGITEVSYQANISWFLSMDASIPHLWTISLNYLWLQREDASWKG